MSIEQHFDQHVAWRNTMRGQLHQLKQHLVTHELLAPQIATRLTKLLTMLDKDRLVVSFVAEFSRGKTELINALFFAHYGRRILPASAGRTTMCPVELTDNGDEPAYLRLLPIETRADENSLQYWLDHPQEWHQIALNLHDVQQLAEVIKHVAEIKWVLPEVAETLGFWNPNYPQDNPPLMDGLVEIPMWRHAVIGMNHPLLQQGLVVLDTPGLNAVGVEPELTMSLLPQSHAVMFVLSADTGVTKSDLDLWREHLKSLSHGGVDALVVLNKIDTLDDALSTEEEIAHSIEQQRQKVAQLLEMPLSRVIATSALLGLTAKVQLDSILLKKSRLIDLERALGQELIGRKRSILLGAWRSEITALFQETETMIHHRERELVELRLELAGLEGKNHQMLHHMKTRLRQEQVEFEACTHQLQQLRDQLQDDLRQIYLLMGISIIRSTTSEMTRQLTGRETPLLERGAMEQLYDNTFLSLRQRLEATGGYLQQSHDKLKQMFIMVNMEQGLSLQVPTLLDMADYLHQLQSIEKGYFQYLHWHETGKHPPNFGVKVANIINNRILSMAQELMSQMEQWHQACQEQVELQLRDRRRYFAKRLDAMQKITEASHQLVGRLNEIQTDETDTRQLKQWVEETKRQCVP